MKLKHIISILFLGLLLLNCQSQNKRYVTLNNPVPIVTISANIAFKETNRTEKLKIATWNIRDLGKTKNEEEIFQIAKIIKDNDIVAL